MIARDELIELISSNSCYTYKFDVTTDTISEDIVDRNGYNYTKAAGLTSPCSFDEIIRRSFDSELLDMEFTIESTSCELSCKAFQRAYARGKTHIEATVFYPLKNVYNRLSYYLKKDEVTGHLIACVICQDVTDMEVERLSHNKTAQRMLAETNSIVADAGIGVWKMVLFDGKKPRMYVNQVMRELLGITDPDMPSERVYEIWDAGIKRSSRPIVESGVEVMKQTGKCEITYSWLHPAHGEIIVRCGATSQYIENKGYILRGYHSNVTEIVTFENRQKQMLADALDEAREQKRKLQQALDNFKQADCDRRTDFLTGLRSRQDMFEMLSDTLSGKRSEIKAVFMLDIDNFKMLNDHYGHSAGDDCLHRIGGALLEYGREHDMYFYRYGGEEMLGVRFSGEDSDEVAQGIVALISGLNIPRSDVETGKVTVSLGYTTDNSEFDSMIDKADRAMYSAKSYGKNRAVCFEKI